MKVCLCFLGIYYRSHHQILDSSRVSHGGFGGLHSASGPYSCDAPEWGQVPWSQERVEAQVGTRGGEDEAFTTCIVVRGRSVCEADGGAGQPRREMCGVGVTAALGREPSKSKRAPGHTCRVPSLIYF